MAYLGDIELFSELDDMFSPNEDCVKDLFNDKDIEDFNCLGVPELAMAAGGDMLAVDSENNILSNPMVDLFGNHSEDLIESQPDFTNFCSETLMPVFLSADLSSAPSSPATASSEEESTYLPISPVTVTVRTENTTQISDLSSEKVIKLSEPNSVDSSSPVRIFVKTCTKAANMVAPLTLSKPSYNLVKVPKIDILSQTRVKAIRSGGKFGATATRLKVNVPTIVRTQLPTNNVPSSLVKTQLPMQNNDSSTSDRISSPGPSSLNSQEQNLTLANLPFRSHRKRTISDVSFTSAESTIAQKVKAYELEPLSDPSLERCRKNALNAKINRDSKKKHLAELERRVEDVSRQRDTLAEENEGLKDAKTKLEQQVKHLNNILKNQSKLATVLSKLDSTKVSIDLSTRSENEVISSGMCLHMDGFETTIKYCSYCAKKNGE